MLDCRASDTVAQLADELASMDMGVAPDEAPDEPHEVLLSEDVMERVTEMMCGGNQSWSWEPSAAAGAEELARVLAVRSVCKLWRRAAARPLLLLGLVTHKPLANVMKAMRFIGLTRVGSDLLLPGEGRSPKAKVSPTGTISPGQLQASEWLVKGYENGFSPSILSLEPGLDAKPAVLGTLMHLSSNGLKGPFLLAAPEAAIPDWLHGLGAAGFTCVRATTGEELQQALHDDWKRVFVVPSAVARTDDVDAIAGFLNLVSRVESNPNLWKYVICDQGEREDDEAVPWADDALLEAVLTEMQPGMATAAVVTRSPLPNSIDGLLDATDCLRFRLPESIPDVLRGYAFGDADLELWAEKSFLVPMIHSMLSGSFYMRCRLATDAVGGWQGELATVAQCVRRSLAAGRPTGPHTPMGPYITGLMYRYIAIHQI
jgi:hypothetical protein